MSELSNDHGGRNIGERVGLAIVRLYRYSDAIKFLHQFCSFYNVVSPLDPYQSQVMVSPLVIGLVFFRLSPRLFFAGKFKAASCTLS
jgi:hypothetical protein